jgi:uncharacterized membrane protein YkvA (DUF1232 family)
MEVEELRLPLRNDQNDTRYCDCTGGPLKCLTRAAKALKQQVLAVYYATQDPECPCLAKCLALFTLAYALSPLDLIPDFIPILGILDDLILLPAMIALTIKLLPKDVWERAKERAENEPLRLSANWKGAVAVFILWTTVVLVVVSRMLTAYGSPYWQANYWVLDIGLGVGMLIIFTVFMWYELCAEKSKTQQEAVGADSQYSDL